jgi:hypothetical protein
MESRRSERVGGFQPELLPCWQPVIHRNAAILLKATLLINRVSHR